MLERATTSAECTAHILLRSFESPTRSRRVLGPVFWKSAGDRLNVPTWWPIYLNNVRNRSQDHVAFLETLHPTTLQNPLGRQDTRRPLERTPSKHGNGKPRSFTRSAAKTQEISAVLDDEFSSPGAASQHFQEGTDAKEDAIDTIGTDKVDASEDSSDIMDQAERKEQPDYPKIWQRFINSGQKGATAPRVMHFLSESEDRIDLRRALTAFEYIDRSRCSRKDFNTAARIAMQLRNYKVAISIVQNAVGMGIGENVYFMFMAHCVRYTLWNTLATLWDSIGHADHAKLQASTNPGIMNRSPNMAGTYSFHFNDIPDLPSKIVSLADRLHRSDAVLAFHRNSLAALCRRLVYIAVESEKVMSSITGKGILSLFHVQQQLGFKSKLHLAALATLMRMPDNGARSQLAIMIYRNYRYSVPDAIVPPWVYGSLITICAASRQPPDIYTYLLDEFRHFHGRPDEGAYRDTIRALAAQGEADAVLKLFDQLHNEYGPRAVHDLNSLIHVYAVVGNSLEAQRQFDRIENEFKFRPDVVSWTSLVLAYARSADDALAYRVFQEMSQQGIKPNAYTWSIIMSVAAKRGDVRTARLLYHQALKEKVSGNLYMVGTLVEAFVLNDQLSHAEAIVIRTSKVQSSESPIRLWNTLFRHYAFKGQSDDILRLQKLMKEHNVEADGMTYAALMTALVVQRRTEDAVKILRTLHFNQSLNPTEFHYSILIHGFALEKKRDLATVIYHEMLERFPKATPSARLAMLHLQMARDASAAEQASGNRKQPIPAKPKGQIQTIPWTGLDYLANTLIERSPSDLASKQPNPGFGRRSPRDGLNLIYFHSLVGFLQSKAAYSESQRLLDVSRTLFPNDVSPRTDIDGLNLEMNIAMNEQKWQRTRELWDQILRLAHRLGSAISDIPLFSVTSNRAPANPPTVSNTDNSIGLSGDLHAFKPMVDTSRSAAKINITNRIVPAKQFAISKPLSTYMQALDYQRQHTDIVIVVQDLLYQGFKLSSKNWNRYVQVLSKSSTFEHRVLAFEAFEKNLLPNMPIWRLLRRGKWSDKTANRIRSEDEPLLPSNRDDLEKLQPDISRPTYFTMIHLALALLKANRSAANGDSQELNRIRRNAPGTLDRVQKTPYFGDRIQGLLLRGRDLIGDPAPRPRAAKQVLDVSGVKGSKSPLDNIPLEILERVESVIIPRDDIRTLLKGFTSSNDDGTEQTAMSREVRLDHYRKIAEQISGKIERNPLHLTELDRHENDSELSDRVLRESNDKLDAMLELGEQVSGEIDRRHIYLIAQDRKESADEHKARIEAQELQKLEVIAKIRKDAYRTSLVVDKYSGEPAVDLPSTQIGVPIVRYNTNTEGIAESLISQDARDVSKLADNIHELIKSNKGMESKNEAMPIRRLPSRRIKSFRRLGRQAWAPDADDMGIDTKVLVRRIDVNEQRLEAAQAAFIRNKARRREKVELQQDFARWDRLSSSNRESRQPTNPAKLDTSLVPEKISRKGSARVSRLYESRGAKRFG